jgi:hypothetical protein
MATVWRNRKGERMDTEDRIERVLTRDMFSPDVEVCSFCGESESAAWWMGHQQVSVCRRCALEVLPCLMADALVGERGDLPHALVSLHRDLETVLKGFWRAVAIATHRVCAAPPWRGARRWCGCRSGAASTRGGPRHDRRDTDVPVS